jgi:hypothetical protein
MRNLVLCIKSGIFKWPFLFSVHFLGFGINAEARHSCVVQLPCLR